MRESGSPAQNAATGAVRGPLTPPEIIVRAAREAGVVFQLSPEGDLFTLEWRGPVDPLIEAAIRDNYDAILDLLRREAGVQ